MRSLFLSFIILYAIGGLEGVRALAKDEAETKSELKKNDDYFEPLTILTRNCAGCHQQDNHPGALFLNKEHLSEPATIKLMIRLIKTSQMPPAHAKFKTTKDGKKLLAWLKKQSTGTEGK